MSVLKQVGINWGVQTSSKRSRKLRRSLGGKFPKALVARYLFVSSTRYPHVPAGLLGQIPSAFGLGFLFRDLLSPCVFFPMHAGLAGLASSQKFLT